MTSAFSWIKTDETAKDALHRILTERPLAVLPPPLHRLPFRVGNVVEIAGPSPSAKTLTLIQVAITCILPKEWKGVQYRGLERAVLYIDLECRFDVVSLSRALRKRIEGANGVRSSTKGKDDEYCKELFELCMRRFLFIRCYNSNEFLATLKTLHYRFQKMKEKDGISVYMLLIDSIGAHYWMDRALLPSSGSSNRKSFSLQTVTETVVQEICKLMRGQPLLVLAAKSAYFGDTQKTTAVSRNSEGPFNPSYRDFMPHVWQLFVSHRILLRPSDDKIKNHFLPTFSTQWLLPPLKFSDNFTINDDGMLIIL